jgi:hypothetical protein
VLRLLLLALLSASFSSAAVTYWQSRATDGSSGSSATPQSLTLAYSSNVTRGNTLVVGCVTNGVTSPSFTISDTQSNVYTSGFTGAPGSPPSDQTIQISYAIASGTGPNTVTCQVSGTGTAFTSMVIAEYSGLGTGNITDGSSSGTSSTTTGDCGSITTTNANDLLFLFASSDTGSTTWSVTTPPTGFTMRTTDSNGGSQVSAGGDKVVSTTQSAVTINYTVQNSDAAHNVCAVVGLKAAVVGPFPGAFLNQPLTEQ